MAKLELTISASSLDCLSLSDKTAEILGVHGGQLHGGAVTAISSLLADANEFQELEIQVKKLLEKKEGGKISFVTFSLVFSAPNAPTAASGVDRSPVQGIFRSPIQAIHTCGELQISCFVHLELSDDAQAFHLTAMEYSREHRENMLRVEFGSWLLEEHIEKAVIATDPVGRVVFWNRFASELYQWDKEEAVGHSILELTPSEMTREQNTEIVGRLLNGEHWKGMFGVRKKDGTSFMAHVTDTPILDRDGALKFVVGVSVDYTQFHDLMGELETINTDLEMEVLSRSAW